MCRILGILEPAQPICRIQLKLILIRGFSKSGRIRKKAQPSSSFSLSINSFYVSDELDVSI